MSIITRDSMMIIMKAIMHAQTSDILIEINHQVSRKKDSVQRTKSNLSSSLSTDLLVKNLVAINNK